jgi:hypothetical protein
MGFPALRAEIDCENAGFMAYTNQFSSFKSQEQPGTIALFGSPTA